MAMTEMNYMSGGGNIQQSCGEIDSGGEISNDTGQNYRTIDCGFKPKYVILWFDFRDTTGGQMIWVYDESVDNSKATRWYVNSKDVFPLPNTTYGGLRSIENNGFTLYKATYSCKLGYYYAWG